MCDLELISPYPLEIEASVGAEQWARGKRQSKGCDDFRVGELMRVVSSSILLFS